MPTATANDPSRREPPASSSSSTAPYLWQFFILAFALAWIVFFALAALSRRIPVYLLQPLSLLGVFAPGLAAIAITALNSGRTGLRALLSPLFRWRVQPRWYLFAIFYMPAVKLLVALIYRLIAGVWPRFGSEAWYLMLIALIFSTPFQAGEEIGWRGFALPRLATRYGPAGASLILGVIWALWHLPLFFVHGADTYGQSLTVYVLQVTALSVAIAWLYFRSGKSLLLTMLLHAAINNTKDIVPSITAGANNIFSLQASTVAWLTASVLWVCVGYLLFSMRSWGSQQAVTISTKAVTLQ